MRAAWVAAVAIAALACGPRPRVEQRRDVGAVDGGDAAVEASAAPAGAPWPGPRLPDAVAPTAYRLTLELDPAEPTFRGEVTIELAIAAPTDRILLNARGLEIDDARLELGGASARVPVTAFPARELVSVDVGRPIAGAARLVLAYRGAFQSSEWAGLFRESDAGGAYVFSQFEAMHARRAVPCFDEPGRKTPWEVTLVVPAGLVAASNAPEVARDVRADGRLEVRFAPTPPMPSYLLAVAVGPFDVVDVGPVGRAAVPARILVPHGRAADAAVAVAETPRVVTALEAFFDRPLPLAKLDQVAIPRFAGAMENLGLVTYAGEALLASPSRPAAELRRDFLAVAAHELAHQWTGNLVTMAWWDDLWLNESFATWLADAVIVDLDPRRDVVTERRRSLMTAIARDLRATTAVRHPVATSAEADAAFDALAYEKGAAVLAMFARAMGADSFRAAIRAFIAAHAGGNATLADLAAALRDAGAGPEVADGLTSFLDRPGLPRVELSLDCAVPAVVASVSRALPVGGAGPGEPPGWTFPLCVRFPDTAHRGTIVERCGWIAGTGGRVELGGADCPAWIAGGAGGTGYYQLAYAPSLDAALRDHLGEVPVVDRGTLAAGVIAELRTGRIDVAGALAWADRLLAAPDRHDTIAAVELLAAIGDQLGPDVRPRWQAWLRTHLAARARAAGLRAKVGETAAAAEARRSLVESAGLAGEDAAVRALGAKAARAWLDGGAGATIAGGAAATIARGAGAPLAGDDLALALRLAIAGGDAGLFDRLRDRLAATAGDRATRGMLIDALAAATTPALIDRALDVAFTDVAEPFELVELLGALLANPAAQERTWAALVGSPSRLDARLPAPVWSAFARRLDVLCTPAQRADADALLRPRAAADPDLSLALTDALESIDDCLARRAHHAASAAAAFPPP